MTPLNRLSLSNQALAIIQAANIMDSTLLITGETGTGKSYLAQWIAENQTRRLTEKFHKINLASLSENLIESELFGHEKGAFTGADQKRVGRLEVSQDGIVFLDEIGELPLRLQSKLLDFIQYKKLTPVGSNKDTTVNVRIIAATNKDLSQAVENKEFRSDLYHRLNIFHVHLQPLREQKEILEQLAYKFLNRKSKIANREISCFDVDVFEFFQSYAWPGNIRELENVVEFCCAIEKTNRITFGSLPSYLKKDQNDAVGPIGTTGNLDPNKKNYDLDSLCLLKFHDAKEQFEKLFFERALSLCKGGINRTSRMTGLNRTSLAAKVRRYGIGNTELSEENAFGS